MRPLRSILLLTFLPLMTDGCQYLQESFGPVLQRPIVTVRELQVVSLNLHELKLKIKLLVQNPNNFSLEFSDLNYEIALNEQKVAEGLYKEKIELESEKNVLVDVPLSLATTHAVRIVREALRKRGQLRLDLKGSVDFHSGFGAVKVNFGQHKDLFSH